MVINFFDEKNQILDVTSYSDVIKTLLKNETVTINKNLYRYTGMSLSNHSLKINLKGINPSI